MASIRWSRALAALAVVLLAGFVCRRAGERRPDAAARPVPPAPVPHRERRCARHELRHARPAVPAHPIPAGGTPPLGAGGRCGAAAAVRPVVAALAGHRSRDVTARSEAADAGRSRADGRGCTRARRGGHVVGLREAAASPAAVGDRHGLADAGRRGGGGGERRPGSRGARVGREQHGTAGGRRLRYRDIRRAGCKPRRWQHVSSPACTPPAWSLRSCSPLRRWRSRGSAGALPRPTCRP